MTDYYRACSLIDLEQSIPTDVAPAGRRGDPPDGPSLASRSPAIAHRRCRRAARVRADRARRAADAIGDRAMTVKPPAPPPLPDELDRLLRRLRTPYVRRAAPEVIATATASAGSTPKSCEVLLAEEAAGRDQATIRMRRRASGLPAGKTFDAWEPDAARVIPPQTQQALRTLEWIDRAEVLCDLRPVRDRQEPLHRSARAPRDRQGPHRRLAHARDARATAAPPPRRRQRQQGDRQADPRRPRRDRRCRAASDLRRRGRGAVPRGRRRLRETLDRDLSSNIHPSGFDELMPKSLATATVDRLLHHAHVLITDGQDSYRLAQATAGKGVKPLT